MAITRFIIRGFAGISFISSLLYVLQQLLGGSSAGQGTEKQKGTDGAEGEARESGSDTAQKAPPPPDPRIEEMRRILASDPLIRNEVFRRANVRPYNGALDDTELKTLVERIPESVRSVLYTAATQRDIDFDLKTKRSRDLVDHPTRDIEIEQVTDPADVTKVIYEEHALDDDQFMDRLVNGELRKMAYFETRTKRRLLYILLDISPSMEEKMRNGLPRHSWSRGIVVSLLMKAVRGEAQYRFRAFDGGVYPLEKADTPQEAQRLLDFILRLGYGNSTNILYAIESAVADIKSARDATVDVADVLLITDGEDRLVSVERLRLLLGDKIQLHALLIGRSGKDEVISRVAKTYKDYA